ncbi:hypothetical protein K458DRAFT_426147 [Lentithecium fluviatile CBS 122367]|uniref:3-carboxymuconate cyclase n=1 Tax=Lentithecium fluviatile CBS 122367 TaxID=1168545 RepID=A0A6G1JKD7_9PLEO|nr:hypothetical protein K458DRAFT_426147 [Lentithecium fluviatile CBS 122367]
MARLLAKLLIVTTVLTSVASALPHQRKQKAPATVGKAVYFLTNDAENAVVALPIGKDGTLSAGTVTKTGGAGANSIDGATKQPAVPDALVGQSALTVVGNALFAVNAGSNTLTMMAISKSDPTCLTMVGQPVAIPGEFPNTVAASAKNKLACVGTTGAKAGISCASISARGLGEMDTLRVFNIGQTTPPVGPTNTVSQTFFSADEKALLTTVKGDPAVNNTGFLSVFPVQQGANGAASLSTQDTRSSPAGTAVLFGSATIPNNPNSIFVTDASFGATVLSLDQNGQASVAGKQAIDGQKATCWATVSGATNTAFVTDVATNRVVEMSLDDASIVSMLDLSANGDAGLIDLRSAGNFVYALSPGNGTTDAAVTVLDVSGGPGSMKQAQHFGLAGMAGANAQGMAVLV